MKETDAKNDARRGRNRRFKVGSVVRAKPGTVIEWADDFPIGGWTGTVIEIEDDGHTLYYLVEWSEATLENSHLIYGLIAMRGGDPLDEYYLEERELESAVGESPMEQPTKEFVERFQERDQRIRDVFGITDDELIPNRSDWSLRAYYVHLARRLTFPFEGFYEALDETCDSFDVTVVRLLDPREHGVDTYDGLSCDCREQNRPVFLPLCDITAKHDPVNGQLVSDYAYWVANWEEGEDGDPDGESYFHDEGDGDDDTFDSGEAGDSDYSDEDALSTPVSAAALARKILGEAPRPRDDQDELGGYDEPIMRRFEKVGRNDLCPCGSGKKFKKCCLKPSR